MVSEADRVKPMQSTKICACAWRYFAWLNSDDRYRPDAVSEAVAFLKEHRSGMLWDANLIVEAGHIIGKFLCCSNQLSPLAPGYVHIPQQSLFFERIMAKVGPLDAASTLPWIYDLWVLWQKSLSYYTTPIMGRFPATCEGKSFISDERVGGNAARPFREGGSRFSWLYIMSKVRPWIYGWLPLSLRVRFRQLFGHL
jgi:hypothetical protein